MEEFIKKNNNCRAKARPFGLFWRLYKNLTNWNSLQFEASCGIGKDMTKKYCVVNVRTFFLR